VKSGGRDPPPSRGFHIGEPKSLVEEFESWWPPIPALVTGLDPRVSDARVEELLGGGAGAPDWLFASLSDDCTNLGWLAVDVLDNEDVVDIGPELILLVGGSAIFLNS